MFNLIAEAQNSIDHFLRERRKPTDISEMAQQAVGETLTMSDEARRNLALGSWMGRGNILESSL